MSGEDGISGAALVEFTILAPLLIIMSIYTMDFGLLVYNKIEMQNAAQAGAQWAIANRVYNSSDIQIAAQNATKLPASSFSVTRSQFCGCSQDSGGNPIVTPMTPPQPGACTASSTCASGLVGTYVTVFVTPTSTYTPFIPYGLMSGNPNIDAKATARIQ
jgi:Flp pilus assembly protein TadG